jgi:hypothetical protein
MKTPWRSSFHHPVVEGQGSASHLREGPAALDPRVHVDSPAAGGLRPADEACVGEGVPHDEGHAPDVVPGNAGDGVEVDAQLVGMIEVVGQDRVRIEVETAEVRDPGEAGRVVNDDLVGRPAGGEAQLDRAEPRRPIRGRPLLEEELTRRAVRVALEGHRPAARAAPRPIGDRHVVADELQLRDGAAGGVREVDLVRVRDGDVASGDADDLGSRRHGPEHTGPCRGASRAGP